MLKFLLKRIGYMIVTLWVVITVTFMLMHSIPGDPLASEAKSLPPQVRKNFYANYGLDKPVMEQYKVYIKNIVTEGDLGESIKFPGRRVKDTIKDRFPISGKLGVQAIGLGFIIGSSLGIIAAFKRNTWPDYLVMFVALIGVSIPNFVFAALLQWLFTVKFQILPTTGWGGIKYTILPTIALSLGSLALYARYMRNNCLDVINQDYILTAKAKGVSKFSLAWNHIVRNAILPAITVLGPQIAGIMVGSFVIESMFGIPGLGEYFVSSINNRDFTMIMGLTIFIATLYMISLIVVDVLYVLIDPRIRITGEQK